VIDPRIYRAAFLPVLVALIALMFSVEPIPDALRGAEETTISASDFDQRRASVLARQIVEAAPERSPGSRGDELTAGIVEERFAAIGGGKISEQRFEDSFDGDDVELRNVAVTLPGTSERTIVFVAHRDSARGPGAATSAAATGVLVELAAEFGRVRHEKTLTFVSTDGGSDGASGAREFIAGYPTPELVNAFVVISQPGADEPEPPHILPWSSGSESTSAQLLETATTALEDETEREAEEEGLLGQLSRLALPSGLGDQAVLIEAGANAIAISGAGERPLPPADDQAEDLSAASIGEFARTAFALAIALDVSDDPPLHGPEAQLRFAGNLIPGWALAVLAITLILPALVASLDAVARALRRGQAGLAAFGWVLARALPFLASLVLLYLLALPGIAPSPDFPFDPGRFDFGWRAAGVLIAILTAFLATLIGLRPLSAPASASRETVAAAIGATASVALLGIWLLNPYLALLLVPFAHLWLLAARPGVPVALPGAAVATAIAAVPLIAALVHLVDRLDLGAQAPWQLALFVTSGQIGVPLALLLCLLAGSTLAVLAIGRSPGSDLPAPPLPTLGPARHAGPGSLGGTESALPRR
jgi:hypothetical protein